MIPPVLNGFHLQWLMQVCVTILLSLGIFSQYFCSQVSLPLSFIYLVFSLLNFFFILNIKVFQASRSQYPFTAIMFMKKILEFLSAEVSQCQGFASKSTEPYLFILWTVPLSHLNCRTKSWQILPNTSPLNLTYWITCTFSLSLLVLLPIFLFYTKCTFSFSFPFLDSFMGNIGISTESWH